MNKKTQEIAPELSYEMIDKIFEAYVDQSFTSTTNLRKARKALRTLRNIDHYQRALITAPATTREIISRMSQSHPHQLVAKKLGTPEALAYIRENMFLRYNIFKWSPKTISQKVATFTDARPLLLADAHFLPIKNTKPLPFIVQSNLRKIKMLFSWGVDPNTVFKGKTLLQVALEKRKNSLAETVLAYNPKNKCVNTAIDTENHTILRRILQRKDISTQELNDGLHYSIKTKKIPCMQLFLDAKANPNIHLLKSFTRLLNAIFDEERPDTQILLDIIHTLCLYGAYDKNVDDTVHALRDRMPDRLLASLRLGKEIAQAHEKI